MLLVLLLLALCLGCPGEPQQSTCVPDPIGSLDLPVDLSIIEGGHAVADGDTLTLHAPPQGGFVLYVAVGARNVNTCSGRLSGEVLDPQTRQPFTSLDVRTMNFDHVDGNYGFPEGALNIAACPDNLGAGVAGRDGILAVELTERTGRTTKVERRVKVACEANNAHCACLCGPNYAPGKC